MNDFFQKIFDTSDFPARWSCGRWSAGLGWLHIISDIAIFGAYAAIPISLVLYLMSKRRDIFFPKLYWLFALFIFSCGFGHLVEATLFWHPWYRLSGVVKLITAAASWATVFALVRVMPMALTLPGAAMLNEKLKREIEERKGIEEKLRLAHAEAQQANHAKDSFLAALSHELRTPLNPVKMAIHSWEHQKNLPDGLQQDFKMMRRNIDIQVQLIDDLLDLTAISHGKIKLDLAPVDVHELLQYALETAQFDIDLKKLEIKTLLDAKKATVCTDSTRLTQVFWNLVKNAVKFTPEGGLITVSTANEGEKILIRISDNGPGISPEAFSRIFNTFEQGAPEVRQQFGGLGLGLSIAKSFMESLGGTIKVNSGGIGKGSTFTVSLKALPA